MVWNGAEVGPGLGIVRFALEARPTVALGSVTELVQIGVSRDGAVVATCETYGIAGGNGRSLGSREIQGRRWAAFSNGDAGMSQRVVATDYRTVAGGACYALERVTYSVKANDGLPDSSPTQAKAAASIDAILASITLHPRTTL